MSANPGDDTHRLNHHCDDVMQNILSFVNLKCSKLVNKQWHRLSALNESSQQRQTNQLVRHYQSSFLSQIKDQFPSKGTIHVDRETREHSNIADIIETQCGIWNNKVILPNGRYIIDLEHLRDVQIIGNGDDVSLITSLFNLLVIRGSVYLENLDLHNLRMVVYGNLFIKDCTFRSSSRSGRFTVWMMEGTLKCLGSEFSGIDGIELIDHGTSYQRDVDIVGCKFVSCGKRRAQSPREGSPNGGGGEELSGGHRIKGNINCIGNVFENNSVFPVLGITRKVVGNGDILRGHNGFTMD